MSLNMSTTLSETLSLLQISLQEAFGLPLILVGSDEEVDLEALSLLEQEAFLPITDTPRRSSWLKGRSALKQLLHCLGESTDTGSLGFPHPRFSLTHSGAYALAVGGPAESALTGLGIDYEANRSPSEKSTRFFLTASEKAWLEACPKNQQADARLRLWTVKEALFKADLANAIKRYLDYELEDPSALQGNAIGQDDRALTFRYYSAPALEGWISFACLQNNAINRGESS